jgi:hypothetical protein
MYFRAGWKGLGVISWVDMTVHQNEA